MSEQDKLSGLKILRQSRKHNGKFLMVELDEHIADIVQGIRSAPTKTGSLNIHMSFKPSSTDGQMVVAIAEIKNVKVPTVDQRPILGFTNTDGTISSKDPAQGDFMDEATRIDEETGEVKQVAEEPGKLKQIN